MFRGRDKKIGRDIVPELYGIPEWGLTKNNAVATLVEQLLADDTKYLFDPDYVSRQLFL